jgi:putative transposase
VGYDLRVSYTNLLYHIVYGTKDRVPFITKELRPQLHRYLGGLVNGLHGTPLDIDGTADHVHVLARIKPVISISEFLSKFKSNSSGWANRQTRGKFKWQVKYGAFTVSHSQVDRVHVIFAIRKPIIQEFRLKRNSRHYSRVTG